MGVPPPGSSTHLTLHPTCTFHPRILKDFWMQNSRLFPDIFSKQKFLFPEPCLTIPLPAALASPPCLITPTNYLQSLFPCITTPYAYVSPSPYPCIITPYLMPYHSPLTCLTITLPCLTSPNAYPLSFLTCFTSPYTYALQYFYPLPYHSLLLHLTISFPLPYHILLPCLTISHSTTLHNCTNKLP